MINQLLKNNTPVLLVGPPGSGKTMSAMEVLKKLEGVEYYMLSFSSCTTAEHVLSTIYSHVEPASDAR